MRASGLSTRHCGPFPPIFRPPPALPPPPAQPPPLALPHHRPTRLHHRPPYLHRSPCPTTARPTSTARLAPPLLALPHHRSLAPPPPDALTAADLVRLRRPSDRNLTRSPPRGATDGDLVRLRRQIDRKRTRSVRVAVKRLRHGEAGRPGGRPALINAANLVRFGRHLGPNLTRSAAARRRRQGDDARETTLGRRRWGDDARETTPGRRRRWWGGVGLQEADVLGQGQRAGVVDRVGGPPHVGAPRVGA